MRTYLNTNEQWATQGLSADAKVIYVLGLKPYVNFETAEVGFRRRVSIQSLKETIEFTPVRGSTKKPVKRTRKYIESRINELGRAGLVERLEEDGADFVFRLPLADIDEKKDTSAAPHYSVQMRKGRGGDKEGTSKAQQKTAMKGQVGTLISSAESTVCEELKSDEGTRTEQGQNDQEDRLVIGRADHILKSFSLPLDQSQSTKEKSKSKPLQTDNTEPTTFAQAILIAVLELTSTIKRLPEMLATLSTRTCVNPDTTHRDCENKKDKQETTSKDGFEEKNTDKSQHLASNSLESSQLTFTKETNPILKPEVSHGLEASPEPLAVEINSLTQNPVLGLKDTASPPVANPPSHAETPDCLAEQISEPACDLPAFDVTPVDVGGSAKVAGTHENSPESTVGAFNGVGEIPRVEVVGATNKMELDRARVIPITEEIEDLGGRDEQASDIHVVNQEVACVADGMSGQESICDLPQRHPCLNDLTGFETEEEKIFKLTGGDPDLMQAYKDLQEQNDIEQAGRDKEALSIPVINQEVVSVSEVMKGQGREETEEEKAIRITGGDPELMRAFVKVQEKSRKAAEAKKAKEESRRVKRAEPIDGFNVIGSVIAVAVNLNTRSLTQIDSDRVPVLTHKHVSEEDQIIAVVEPRQSRQKRKTLDGATKEAMNSYLAGVNIVEQNLLVRVEPEVVTQSVVQEAQEPRASGFELVSTVFSAPDVIAETKNKGVRKLKEGVDPVLFELCQKTWDAYAAAYLSRYNAPALRNAASHSMIKRFAKDVGQEAPALVAFYLKHNSPFFIKTGHDLKVLLSNAQRVRTAMYNNVTEDPKLESSYESFKETHQKKVNKQRIDALKVLSEMELKKGQGYDAARDVNAERVDQEGNVVESGNTASENKQCTVSANNSVAQNNLSTESDISKIDTFAMGAMERGLFNLRMFKASLGG